MKQKKHQMPEQERVRDRNKQCSIRNKEKRYTRRSHAKNEQSKSEFKTGYNPQAENDTNEGTTEQDDEVRIGQAKESSRSEKSSRRKKKKKKLQ